MSRDKLYGDWEQRIRNNASPISWPAVLSACFLILVLAVVLLALLTG